MNKRVKKTKRQHILYSIVMLVLLVAIIIMVAVWLDGRGDGSFFADGQQNFNDDVQNQQVDLSTFQIISTTEKNDSVVLVTSLGTLQYSAAFSDVITVNATSGKSGAAIVFSAVLQSDEIPLFTVHYGSKIGNVLGKFVLSDNSSEVWASVEFAALPEGLSADVINTLQAAQEIFNDVYASMEEDSRFVGM